MIIGIGNDIIDIRRIEKTIERFGERFLERVFTDMERAEIGRPGRPCGVLRQALRRQGGLRQGAGHRVRRGVFWRDMGVVNLASGRPTMVLTGGAAGSSGALRPAGYERRIDLT